MSESLTHEQPQLPSGDFGGAVDCGASLPFDAVGYGNEQFLCGFEGDVKSLMWSVEDALRKHCGIDCKAGEFAFGEFRLNDPDGRWAWTIFDFTHGDSSASVVVTAVERGGRRFYSFDNGSTMEGSGGFDSSKLLFEDIPLEENIEVIFQMVATDVLWQLNE